MSTRPSESTRRASGQQRLFEAAVRLFAAKGYAATTVRDIVGEAQVTAPVLYHHFGSKEGLFLAIVREGRDRLAEARQKALDDGGPVSERIRRLCRAHVDLRREFAHLSWAIERIVWGPPEVAPSSDLRKLAAERIRHFESLVEEGIAGGEFRACEPRHVALVLVGVIESASRPPLHEPGSRAEEELEGMLAVILAGVALRTS
jgi:AcrR family transcriptional regulator